MAIFCFLTVGRDSRRVCRLDVMSVLPHRRVCRLDLEWGGVLWQEGSGLPRGPRRSLLGGGLDGGGGARGYPVKDGGRASEWDRWPESVGGCGQLVVGSRLEGRPWQGPATLSL